MKISIARAACRRLESLHLDNASNEEPTLPGSVMLSLLRSVPSLHTLYITGLAGGHDAGDRAQACAALSSLSRLTTLSLYDYRWLPCIQPGLAARLTFLELGGACGSPGDLTVTSAEVAAAVSLMPALEELYLFRGLDFSAEDLRALLDALQPSVKDLRVQHAVMGAAGGRCTIPVHACLEGGLLQSFKIDTPSAGEASAQEIFTFLEAALLPSRVLGPRLPRLRLGLTLKAEAVQEEGAAAFDPFSSELYARCDDAWLWKLRIVAGSSSIDAAQLLGEALQPRTLLWSLDGADFASVSLASGVWRNANAGDEAQAQAQGDGGQAQAQGDGGQAQAQGDGGQAQVQGAGGEGLGQGQAPGAGVEGDGEEDEDGWDPAETAAWVIEEAVESLVASRCPAFDAEQLLFRGPGAGRSLTSPIFMIDWLDQLNMRLSRKGVFPPGVRPRISRFRLLPSAKAILIDCADQPEAAAEAERLLRKVVEGGAGELDIVPTCEPLPYAINELLQALWDGEEEGAPSAEAGEHERLWWLLRVLQALGPLLPAWFAVTDWDNMPVWNAAPA
ncbi:hypothetical protein HYH03_010136 [Edaphochlamys debaryana]|uniref:Uncharacterized protein n=1 Tax=Edaphochlamys debaryana TaxID=47281 RepID=A0A835XWM0_9CHLO|nr:hypothetical protein HYH03_010136 [Edaphochlamys debaryana]|eukprot:KAG2491568.1 hypothetical protein HYH03_010136 [Edaphochlamys debaryana]